MAREEKKRFKYHGRDESDVKERANQTGGNFDRWFNPAVPRYKVKDGMNNLRILPPTWDDIERWGKHWGIHIHIHYGIGPDNNVYLCPNKMKGEDCYLCEERARLGVPEDKEEDELKVGKRVACYVIDRDDEKAGPQFYDMPWTLERDIQNLSLDKKFGLLQIDDPDEGYDVEFKREGKGKQSKYTGIRIDRDPSPISSRAARQEEILEFITENPIPDGLIYRDNDYLEKVYRGKSHRKEEGEDDERPSRKGKKAAEDEDTKSTKASKRPSRDEEDEPEERPSKSAKKPKKGIAEGDVSEMERKELLVLIEDHDLDIDPDDFPKLVKLQAEVIKHLGKKGLLESDGEEDEKEEDEPEERPKSAKKPAKDEEEDEPEERPAKKGSKKEAPRLDPISEAELGDMDEDDLRDTIAKYDLEVDADRWPKLTVLRTKVMNALAGIDMLEKEAEEEPEERPKRKVTAETKEKVKNVGNKKAAKDEEEEEEEEERPRSSKRPSRRDD